VVVVTGEGRKEISTSAGMARHETSPFFRVRKDRLPHKMEVILRAIREKNFPGFGELAEGDALEMHAVMITSVPPLLYWTEGTLHLMRWVHKMRRQGIPVYFTINTGQDIHLLVEGKNAGKVVSEVRKEEYSKHVYENKPAAGARVVEEHLF
jgi:diphosphomevalonate decarboxylase